MTREQYIKARQWADGVERYEVEQMFTDDPAYMVTLAEAVDLLREALRGMLLSADAAWRLGTEGHDWVGACDCAVAALALTAPKAYEEATDE